MAAPAHIARENGKKGGRPRGKKMAKTLEREKVQEAYNQKVFGLADKLLHAQFIVANGTHRMVTITKDEDGKPHVSQVNDQDEMDRLIVEGVYGKDYMILTGHGPNHQAIDSMLNRALGKPKETLEHQGLDFLFDEKTD